MSDVCERDRIILNSIFNPLLPIGEGIYDEDVEDTLHDEEELTPIVEKAKKIELNGVKAAEAGDLVMAEQLLTESISVAERPSGYNNRAQILRLKGKDDDALRDLNKTIELSGGKGKSGCQAYCQRGSLHRKYGRDLEAKDDFTHAAELGSSFAKKQLVEMNPYSAMCNQMLNEMMVKLNSVMKSEVNLITADI